MEATYSISVWVVHLGGIPFRRHCHLNLIFPLELHQELI